MHTIEIWVLHEIIILKNYAMHNILKIIQTLRKKRDMSHDAHITYLFLF
jgi:hypothetical protein